jgi:hypothetical protein
MQRKFGSIGEFDVRNVGLVSGMRRNLITSFLIAPFALTGIGIAQAQVSAPATPAKFSTVYTGDVINGKKVVSSLRTDDLEPSKKHRSTSRVCGCPRASTGTCR